MLKQKRDLAYHERTRLSSMFALKLQNKLGSLPISKHNRAISDFTHAHHIDSAGM